MSLVERKNGWQIAEEVGEITPYAMQHLLDRELYLPKSWADDQERRREAHVPTSVTFATKPELARRMLERTLDAGLPVAWVTGDTVYGSAQPLRAALEARKQAYALAVTCKEQVEVQGTRRRVDQLALDLAREDWQELSAGMGSKGPRLFAWARIELAAPEISGWQRWLLVRRSLGEGTKPAEMAYVLVFAPAGTSLEETEEARGTGSDKSQDAKRAAVYCRTLRVLAPYGNEAVWRAPYRVAWLNSTQTPESCSPRTDAAAPPQ